MNEEPEPQEVDWEAMAKASMNIADLMWTYYQALLASGFNNQQALALTTAWQNQFSST